MEIAIIADTHMPRGPRRLPDACVERLRSRFPEADAVIFGHSHIPWHARASDGFQIFNPGSPTERRRSPHHTMGLARVMATGIEFESIELD